MLDVLTLDSAPDALTAHSAPRHNLKGNDPR